jgi:hypothetical protein
MKTAEMKLLSLNLAKELTSTWKKFAVENFEKVENEDCFKIIMGAFIATVGAHFEQMAVSTEAFRELITFFNERLISSTRHITIEKEQSDKDARKKELLEALEGLKKALDEM